MRWMVLRTPDRRAEANYWYGQWNVVRELQEAIG